MLVTGLNFGRNMQNTEVLTREALMAAKECGMEVALIRMLDLDIKPCRGCNACLHSLTEGGSGECVIKDDFAFLDEQIMQSDGLIIGSPVYLMAPTGQYKTVADRMGPSHDLFMKHLSRKIRAEKGIGKGSGPDERSFNRRVAGFISVGGATASHWLSFGLPLMNMLTFSSEINVIDQMQVSSVSQFGSVVLHSEALARARRMGRNIAEALQKPDEGCQWMGDEQGTCPVCHSNLLNIREGNTVECPVCGIAGEISIEAGRISIDFKPEERKKSHFFMLGKEEHMLEVRGNFTNVFMQRADKDEIPAKLEYYKAYDIAVLKPR